MRLLNFNKALCLSPHPDDVEIGMMGTIMKYNETQFDVLCMTKGGAKGFDATNDMERLAEVNEVWCRADLDNANVMISGCDFFEDKDRDAGWINYIENTFLINNEYDAIFIPTGDDSMYEHRFVNGLGQALIRSSFMSLIEYRIVSTLNTWDPNMFVDIGNQYEKKLECIKYFESQSNKLYFRRDVLDIFHSNFPCKKRGINHVEQYKLIEILQ